MFSPRVSQSLQAYSIMHMNDHDSVGYYTRKKKHYTHSHISSHRSAIRPGRRRDPNAKRW